MRDRKGPVLAILEKAVPLVPALLALGLLSCTSPAGVSEFAETAGRTFVQSSAIFRDLPDSCVRRHTNVAPIAPMFMPAKDPALTPSSNAQNPCATFSTQADGLVRVSDVLNAYFEAIRQLASFNTSAVSTTGEKAGQNGALAANFSTTQADSVAKLAGLVTQLFTERYQRAKLLHLLQEADPAIASVTQALDDIVSKDYEGLLKEEQQSLTAEYQNVADTGNTAVVLLLNRSYSGELDQLNRRKKAAEAYVHALEQIRDGHHQLALNLRHLNANELSMAIQPYTARLKGLVPTFEKGF